MEKENRGRRSVKPENREEKRPNCSCLVSQGLSRNLVQTVDRDDFPYIGEELSRIKLLKMVWKSKS